MMFSLILLGVFLSGDPQPCGIGPQCMPLPKGFVHVPLRGKDSRVGEIRGRGIVITYDDYDLRANREGIACAIPKRKTPPVVAKELWLSGRKICYWMESYGTDRRKLKGQIFANINGMLFYAELQGRTKIDLFVEVVSAYDPHRQSR
jgi:hypothetical protein